MRNVRTVRADTGGDGGTSAKLGMGYSPAYYALHARAERLAGRGGCWFTAGEAEVHLGVDPDFRPARKAHPAILVRGLAALAERLREAGVAVTRDAGSAYVDDPFGNRVELLERGDTLRDRP